MTPTETHTEAATAIAALRADGRTARDIAAAVGVHVSTVYRWARGTFRPTTARLDALTALTRKETRMPTEAHRKLTEQGWTTVRHTDGTLIPLADLADVITGQPSATYDHVNLTSTHDQDHTGPTPPNQPNYSATSRDGAAVYSWTERPYTLPAELHPGYATRSERISQAAQLAATQDGTRDAYETACAAADLEPMTDEKITSYGMTYGDFSPAQDPDGCTTAAQTLSRPRREQLKADTNAARQAAADAHYAADAQDRQAAAAAGRRCTRCKVGLPKGTGMQASLGLACDDCYDYLAD